MTLSSLRSSARGHWGLRWRAAWPTSKQFRSLEWGGGRGTNSSSRPFAEGAQGRFQALDKLFSHSCGLHVLPVVLTSPQTTQHTSPFGGGSCSIGEEGVLPHTICSRGGGHRPTAQGPCALRCIPPLHTACAHPRRAPPLECLRCCRVPTDGWCEVKNDGQGH